MHVQKMMLLKGDNSQIKHGKYPQRSGINNYTVRIEVLKDTKNLELLMSDG